MVDKKNIMQLIMLLALSCIANTVLSQTFWITSNADSGPGTVRQIITDLNNSTDTTNTIKVSLAGNVEVVLESNLPAITKPVTFNGQDLLSPSQLILNGNNVVDVGLELATDTQLFNIYRIENVTIVNIEGDSAIGIITDVRTLTIDNCTVTNITAGNQGSNDGSEFSVAIGIDARLASTSSANKILNSSIDDVENKNINGSAYGILFDSEQGLIDNCTIKNITCGENKTSNQNTVFAAGIFHKSPSISITPNQRINNNTIMYISAVDSSLGSGSSTTNSFSTAYGIRSIFNLLLCRSNTISYVTSGSADTSLAEGISVTGGVPVLSPSITFNDNTISYIISGTVTTNSTANGIFINQITQGTCIGNTVSHLVSNEGATSIVTGIKLLQPSPANSLLCNQNTVLDIDNTLADNATVTGIFIGNTQSGNECNENTITNLTASQESTGICIDTSDFILINTNIIKIITAQAAFGIKINEANRAFITGNSIESITATKEAAYGILLGSEGSSSEENNNNVITDNNIKHVTGPQGFGISILNQESNRNFLFTNLICDITTKAIEIEAQTDATCKIFHATLLPNGDLQVQGVLDDVAVINESYNLQFFVNDCNTIPQTPTLIGNVFFDSIGNPAPFNLTFTPLVPVQVSQYITMTAAAGEETLFNSSEVSNTRRVRTSTGVGAICALVCGNGSDDGSCCIINR